MTKDETLRMALEALEKLFGIPDMLTGENSGDVAVWRLGGSYRTQQAIHAIKEALAQPKREILGNVDYIPCCTDQTCPKCKPPQPKQDIPTMDDAIAAGNGVLMNEQAALLRECRSALDSLIQQKPQLAGLLCGSTTLGNLKASLYGYRPQGVFNPKEWQDLTDEEIGKLYRDGWSNNMEFARAIEAKLRSKNT